MQYWSIQVHLGFEINKYIYKKTYNLSRLESRESGKKESEGLQANRRIKDIQSTEAAKLC